MKSPNNNSIEYEISGRKMTFPNGTVHSLFTKQAEINPNSIALEFEDKQVTYAKLDAVANQMAHFFWTQGLRPGQIVAVSLDRTPELIACLFAVLKCGAAYLPLDPKFPIARLEFMIEDSDASFLLTSKSLYTSLPYYSKTTVIEDILPLLDKQTDLPLSIPVSQEVPAYILYTSGSTGKPKGVTVNHKNLVNFLYSMKIQPGINENDKLLSITTISFDIAGLELFLPLFFGATVVFADYETTRDGQLLLKVLEEKEITILQATPTTWQLLLDSGWEKPLPLKALCGGEAMPKNLAQQLTSRCDSLWNMYGPTETTIWSTIKEIKSDDELITIGLPIANTQIYLLNEQRQAVVPGSIGEIVIGGDGVAQGYWKRPELTAEKFIPNPFSKETNSILYRTGDFGKLLPNGELQCLGRIDNQVKIRGHRVELGEIEATLNSLPGIKQSAVIVSNYSGNEDKLVAYLKSNDQLQDKKLILDTLSKILPEILIPSNFIWVDDFPITPNGKIDKNNLKHLDSIRHLSSPHLRLPTTKIEKEITQIWSVLLQIPSIGIDNNFFELGGTSLTLSQLAFRIKKKYRINLTFRQLSEEYNTPFLLVEYLNKHLLKEDSANNNSQQTIQEIKNDEIENHHKQLDTALTLILPDKNNSLFSKNRPVPEARLGRDENGNPAWFIEDPNTIGKYIKVNV
jgi:amino acid adenylation domain-containing protein